MLPKIISAFFFLFVFSSIMKSVKPLCALNFTKSYLTRQLDPICRPVHFPEACVLMYTPNNKTPS